MDPKKIYKGPQVGRMYEKGNIQKTTYLVNRDLKKKTFYKIGHV
jgi:hypothetical protein